jgi:ribosomal protein L28
MAVKQGGWGNSLSRDKMSQAKRQNKKRFNNFIMVPRKILNLDEWKNLSPSAKILYIHLKARYNGSNNGSIHLHYSELTGIKGLSSHSTISKAFKELLDKAWIKRTRFGGLYRYSNQFELTGRFDDYI